VIGLLAMLTLMNRSNINFEFIPKALVLPCTVVNSMNACLDALLSVILMKFTSPQGEKNELSCSGVTDGPMFPTYIVLFVSSSLLANNSR
jgi:hypothetical protein